MKYTAGLQENSVTLDLYWSTASTETYATLNPLVLFMTGALSGVLASNGLKDKENKENQE